MNTCLWNFPLTPIFQLYSEADMTQLICQYVCVSISDDWLIDIIWDCDK